MIALLCVSLLLKLGEVIAQKLVSTRKFLFCFYAIGMHTLEMNKKVFQVPGYEILRLSISDFMKYFPNRMGISFVQCKKKEVQ